MANKTSITAETKHAMVDIEISIDAQIRERVQEVKDEYTTAIKDFRDVRDDNIRDIRATKRGMMKTAEKELMEA